MKKLFFLPVFAVATAAFVQITNKSVDVSKSNIVWTGAKVTGTHTGNVKVKSGTLSFDGDKLVGGNFEIDMNSITCTDLQGEWGDKLVGHLKSPDFFGVESHPTSKFTITRAIPTDLVGNYKIVGNLTIKNITKEIKFNALVKNDNGKTVATGKITVDRSDFDVRFGSGSFFDNLGDKTIYDEFTLDVNLVSK